MTWWKKALFAAVTVVAFFALLEAALWAAGVEALWSAQDPFQGFSRSVRVFERDASGEWRRTASRAVRHSFNLQQFRAAKPANGLRVFVLGGSSAYGFPWGAGAAFPRWLGEALAASWAERQVEVVNAAGMSYGFQRLRILTHEVLEYDPDVLVYYEGHNEFVERRLFERLLARTHRLQGLQAVLFRSRLYSAMWRLWERWRPAAKDARADAADRSVGELLGLDVVREDAAQTLLADKVRAAGTLRENLEAILDLAARRRVRVVLCTVPTNLRDWAPNQSLFGPETTAAQRDAALGLLRQAKSALDKGAAGPAAGLLEQARGMAPGYAEIHFVLGRAYEALGRYDDARAAYVRARDLDAQPVRAISLFNDTIRSVAAEGRVGLVDVEREFERASPHGLVGFNLIEDYVHPNRQGHRLIALALWKFLDGAGWLGSARSTDPAVFWKAVGGEAIPPGGAPAQAEASTPAELYNLALVMDKQGEKARAATLYRQCLDLDPRYYAAGLNLGMVLAETGDLPGALQALQQAHAAEPRRAEALVELGVVSWRMRKLPEAESFLRRAVQLDPKGPKGWDTLGMVLAFQGRSAEATEMFRKAVALAPDNYVAQANLGSSLLLSGNAPDAIGPFRAALRFKHDFTPARDGLADALAATGALDEAADLYRESLAADAGDARAAKGLESVERRRKGGRDDR